MLRSILSLFILSLLPGPVCKAMCSVNSTNGYTVFLNVRPVAIVPATDNCPGGYNYVVRMAYDIAFIGPNAPGSMYTLQGYISCGSSSIYFDLPNNGGSGTVLTSNAWTTRTDCTTASPTALSCNTVNIRISGPSLTDRTIPCTISVLPIELVSFTASPGTNAVDLEWSTASETDNDHFTVERSTDGTTFQDLLHVAAVGHSSSLQRYNVSDTGPIVGTTYYRLRQTDLDGSSTTSRVVAVMLEAPDTFTIYPNPVTHDQVHLSVDASGCMVQLFSGSGRVVHQAELQGRSIQLPPLPSGVYEMRLTDGRNGTVRSSRLLIE